MNHRALRHIAPIVLLAAYLPMLVMSSLHVHHDTVDLHDDCLQCVGHFEAQHHHQSDCQYCHFLSLDYLSQAMGQSTILLPTAEMLLSSASNPTMLLHHGVAQLRAPPVA